MKTSVLILFGAALIVSATLPPQVIAAPESRSMEQHMQIQAKFVKDPALDKLPSIRIDSVLANVPVNDRLNADSVYGRLFTDALRDGMSWCLAERGMRVVTSGEDLRLAGMIEEYAGDKGWHDWGVEISVGFKVFRGAERLPSIDLHSLLKYSDDDEVRLQEQPKYRVQNQTVTFPEVLFTRIGVDLCEKLIDVLKERGDLPTGWPTSESVATQRGSISIDASVANAEVRIDGQLIGTVPLANIPLPAGRHSIQMRKKGFNVWQEDVVILPDAASHLTAELEPEHESSGEDLRRQKETMAEIRAIGNVFEMYSVDHNAYPGPTDRFVPATSLRSLVEPTYIRSLPILDKWEHPYLIHSTGTSYVIISFGRDGKEDRRLEEYVTGTGAGGPTKSVDNDIVYSSGTFVQWPAGLEG